MPQLIDDVSISDDLKQVMKIAEAIARENIHAALYPAHLLKALLHRDAGLHSLIKSLGEDIYYLEEWADVRMESLPKKSSLPNGITGDKSVGEVMREADDIRIRLSQEMLQPLHVLAAISTPGVGFSFEQLKHFPLRRDQLIATASESDALDAVLKHPGISSQPQITAGSTGHALLKYCIDKSAFAREGKIDPIVGRDKEVRMMSEILCRRSKPNVLIVGDPGVGKTALVDGFALAIQEQQVPILLQKAQVFELDCGALVAGAAYKGEIEDRLKSIIADIKQLDKAILFIDEIHTLVDRNGAAAGAANLLKPELARGEITVIGATTLDEYRKYIQVDEAFNRRFEQLSVDEPDSGTCFRMMQAIMPCYAKHHGIAVPEDTIHETIRLAKRYLKDRRLPDAAIDLADRSMAALRMINDNGLREMESFRDTLQAWKALEDTPGAHTLADWQWLHQQMKQQLSPILWAGFQSEDDPAAMTAPAAVIQHVSLAIESLLPAAAERHDTLTIGDVAAIVSFKTGIPIGKVQTQERERLMNIEKTLQQRVIGQDQAIKTIAEAVLEARSGLNKPGQPIGSFFFLGPTGTGKTELSKALAEFLFQDESAMIRFDMSEFKEQHSAALLYGAPPGYVGFQEGGLLVNKIRQKPYSVVLFDEIEKAHDSVFDIFLQIMDEGKLHDKLGKEGDFSNALIIFTSNIGSHYVEEAVSEGGTPSPAKLLEIMADHFRPEFLGRLTEIVPFVPITAGMVERILQVQLRSLLQVLDKKDIDLSLSTAASGMLASAGFSPRYGARPLAGIIRSQLRRPLSRKLISGELQPGSKVFVDLDPAGALDWKIQHTGAKVLAE